jgi:hypothetical protein
MSVKYMADKIAAFVDGCTLIGGGPDLARPGGALTLNIATALMRTGRVWRVRPVPGPVRQGQEGIAAPAPERPQRVRVDAGHPGRVSSYILDIPAWPLTSRHFL